MVIYCSKPFQPTPWYQKPYDRHQNHPSRCCSCWVMSKFHFNLVYFLFQKKRQLSRPPPQTKKSFFEILQKRTSFSNCLLNKNPEWKHRFFEYFDFESRMTYPNGSLIIPILVLGAKYPILCRFSRKFIQNPNIYQIIKSY